LPGYPRSLDPFPASSEFSDLPFVGRGDDALRQATDEMPQAVLLLGEAQ
jgi:hypothetical protein